MRYFPVCSEGFRRLSLVVAALVFILALATWISDSSRTASDMQSVCANIYVDQEGLCNDPQERNHDVCIQKADDEEKQCFNNAGFYLYKVDTWETVGVFAIGALFLAYVSAFAVRGTAWIVRWIALGFSSQGVK